MTMATAETDIYMNAAIFNQKLIVKIRNVLIELAPKDIQSFASSLNNKSVNLVNIVHLNTPKHVAQM